MTRRSSPTLDGIILVCSILSVCAVLYGLLRQHIFTIDSLYYLWDAEFADWPTLLHPHHLALEPLLRGWYRLWQWFGWPGRAVLPLQILNVLVTVATLGLMWRLLARLTGARPFLLALWTTLFATLYLTWYHATQAEGVPLFAFFGTACLVWAAELPRDDRTAGVTNRHALGLAATMVGSVLVHQSLVLWTPLLAWMLAREAAPGRRLRLGALGLAAAGGAVLACYLLAGAVATGGVVPGELTRWVTGYSEEFSGQCGSLQLLFSRDVPRGLGSALLTGMPLKEYAFAGRPADARLVLLLAPFGLLAILMGLGLLGVLPAWARRGSCERRALLNVLLLTVLGFLFAGWWEPSNRKFWAPVLPGLVALAALGWTAWRGRGSRLAPVLLGLVLAATVTYNLAGGILPRHRENDAHQPLLVFLARHVGPEDAVVLREDRVWQCAIYFRAGQSVHGIPGPRSDRDDPDHTVWQAAVADARRALLAGAHLYVADEEWPTLQATLEPELGPLSGPEPVLEFADADLPDARQVLYRVERNER